MAILLPNGGQSSSAVNGQSTTFITDKIIMQLPAAPDTLVNSVLSDVLREFYTNTGAWREIVGPYPVMEQIDSVDLNPVDQYSQVQYVLQAWLYPYPTGASNTRQFLAPSTRKVFAQVPGLPSSYFMERPDKLHFGPVPDQDYGDLLWVYAIMLPLVSTTQLPNISTTHHLDALQFGVLERLLRMPSRPWTNMKLSAEYHNLYSKEKRRAQDVANRSFTAADAPQRFPGFAGRYQDGSQTAARSTF